MSGNMQSAMWWCAVGYVVVAHVIIVSPLSPNPFFFYSFRDFVGFRLGLWTRAWQFKIKTFFISMTMIKSLNNISLITIRWHSFVHRNILINKQLSKIKEQEQMNWWAKVWLEILIANFLVYYFNRLIIKNWLWYREKCFTEE